MFPALLEKLNRRHDLTGDEAAGAMTEIIEGRAGPAHIAGLFDRVTHEGGATGGDRRPREDHASTRGEALEGLRGSIRHLRNRGRPLEQLQCVVGRRRGRRGVRGTRGQAWEPLGLEPVRQR